MSSLKLQAAETSSDLDELYRLLRGAHVQAQAVVDTIRDPLLVLGADLTVISANPVFYRTFETGRDATIGSRSTSWAAGSGTSRSCASSSRR
jgi:PAS domain-containing protein